MPRIVSVIAPPRPSWVLCACGAIVAVGTRGRVPKGCKGCGHRTSAKRYRGRRRAEDPEKLREELRISNGRWRKEHPEQSREISRKSMKKRRARLRAEDPEKLRAVNRLQVAKYRAKYPKKLRAQRDKENAKLRAQTAQRRALSRRAHEQAPRCASSCSAVATCAETRPPVAAWLADPWLPSPHRTAPSAR